MAVEKMTGSERYSPTHGLDIKTDHNLLDAAADKIIPFDADKFVADSDEPVGVKADKEKDPWEFVPWGPFIGVVKVLGFGARKYSPDNWRRVPNAKMRYYAAAMRHLIAWRIGERLDPESGLPHLYHAMCSLLFVTELDDQDSK